MIFYWMMLGILCMTVAILAGYHTYNALKQEPEQVEAEVTKPLISFQYTKKGQTFAEADRYFVCPLSYNSTKDLFYANKLDPITKGFIGLRAFKPTGIREIEFLNMPVEDNMKNNQEMQLTKEDLVKML